MSAPHERTTLAPSLFAPSLFAYARDLRSADPGTPLPKSGYPLPDSARPPRSGRGDRTYNEALTAVTDVLASLLAEPEENRAAAQAPGALAATGVRHQIAFSAAADLPLPDDPMDRARTRALARSLTRDGTTTVSVAAGLGLLTRLGEAEDVPYLRALGLLKGIGQEVVAALTPLDRSEAAFVWLIHRARGAELLALVAALAVGAGNETAAVRDRFLAIPTGPPGLGPEVARNVAEAVDLTALLRREPDRPGLLAQAIRVLVRMVSRRDYETEIRRHSDAVSLYETVAAHVHRLPRELGHRADLVSLALDLHSGAGHVLAWPPGRREELLDTLLSVVGEPDDTLSDTSTDPAGRRRAAWIRRTVRQLRAARRLPSGAPRFRIEVAVADPGDPDVVETRFLIDGRPLVPEAFGRGPGESPESLIDSGRLRATSEPREVRLAEAYCTEGCCGALYVTVRREGDHVVWDGWRRTSGERGLPELSAYRFDAVAYDAEIARAERDQSWAWPARHTARLIAAGLRDRPESLTRWGLRQGWISTEFDAPDTTLVTFTGPDEEGERRQFLWRIPDDGTPPEEQAAEALRRLEEGDPRGYAELRG
ncbi:hypothetical protein ABZ572_18585 [Streptomyces sp. NPDC018338]|uniref:hypothetical protein n=1 Tax=Streptomyces sp. NPDC018338 TaxID=3157192 RepID=UPI00340369F6